MNTYYCVTSSWDDRGRGTVGITEVRDAEELPESSFTSTKRKDIYNDWYESYGEALAAIEETKRISARY